MAAANFFHKLFNQTARRSVCAVRKNRLSEMFRCSAYGRIRLLGLLAFTLVTTASASAQAMKPGGSDTADSLDLSKYTLRLVYSNNFSNPQQVAREEDFIRKSANGAWQRTGTPNPKA